MKASIKILKLITIIFLIFTNQAFAREKVLLNVSFDPTRELYKEINKAFENYWYTTYGQKVVVKQSHGGSGKQARAVMEGLNADIVSLALSYDIDAIAKRDLIDSSWKLRFPENSSPYGSTIVFIVKRGNPHNIKDWDDLANKNIKVITPNPKTSGGARWNYVAALAYATSKYKNEERVNEFLKKIFKKVPILDVSARSSTITFVKRNVGDVLIAWENEAHLIVREFGANKYEIVIPSISVKADLPVTYVDKVVTKKKTKSIAEGYLNFLYEEIAQEIMAKKYYRVINQKLMDKYKDNFPYIKLVDINQLGGWEKIHAKHFDENTIFDQIILSK
jgi:sulfate transport system substrate-binding protein